MIRSSFGNMELLELPKTAFLCSRKVSANTVLKCYDWAIAQQESSRCVISGFHSQIEKDVLHYLLKGTQPIILDLARGLKVRIELELKQPLEQGKLIAEIYGKVLAVYICSKCAIINICRVLKV